MAKNTHPYYWTFGIPAYDAAHKFVYMNDLKESKNYGNPIAMGAKERLLSHAQRDISKISADLAADSSTISSALQFLENISTSERAKELEIIKDYRKKLQEELPNDKKLDIFLKKLDANLLNNPADLNSFYTELIKYLSILRTSATDYKNRLTRLKKHQNKEMKDLYQDDYRFRAVGDVSSLLNNLIGTATRAQEKNIKNYSAQLRSAAMQYFQASGLINILSSGADIAAAMAAIELDLEKKMQQEIDEKNLTDFVDLLDDDFFSQIIDKYINATGEAETRLQRAIKENNMELTNIIESAKKVLNIELIPENKREARDTLMKKRKRELSEKRNLNKQLVNLYKNNKAIQELQYVQFNVGAKSSIKIQFNTGADTLVLASFSFDAVPTDIKEQLLPLLNGIEDILNENEKVHRKDRFDERTQAEIAMNEAIDTAITKTEDLIKLNNIPIDNLFVYHQSLKLYKSAETNEMNGFHGRDLKIQHYFDKLYSANGTADLDLPNRDLLEMLSLNLSSEAIGSGQKAAMENYLSIFAGLLMFDDVQLIAKDAAQYASMQPSGTIKQIHLYNLNGIYVPSSMILSFIHETMQSISQIALNNKIAKATINTSAADDVINTYLNSHPRPTPLKEQWPKVAEGVASGTSVRITILGAFNELLNKLFEGIGI